MGYRGMKTGLYYIQSTLHGSPACCVYILVTQLYNVICLRFLDLQLECDRQFPMKKGYIEQLTPLTTPPPSKMKVLYFTC